MISIDIAGPGPFTGLLCGFRFYLQLQKVKNLPIELKDLEQVADSRVPEYCAFLVRKGELIRTYVAKGLPRPF